MNRHAAIAPGQSRKVARMPLPAIAADLRQSVRSASIGWILSARLNGLLQAMRPVTRIAAATPMMT
jgi:hypothetical protein